MQTVWLLEELVEHRQAEVRRQVQLCRRVPRSARPPRAPWKVRLGWRLVELGLRLALPGGASTPAALGPLAERLP
jgi:hypothetical protein